MAILIKYSQKFGVLQYFNIRKESMKGVGE